MKPKKQRPFPTDSGQGASITFFSHRARSPLGENLAANHYRSMSNFDSSPPMIDMTMVPKTEMDAALHLCALLVKLNYYVRCFEADVQLYEFSAEQNALANEAFARDSANSNANEILEILDAWPVIAARDGALSIYNFGRTLDGIDETLSSAPGIGRKIERPLRKEALRKFRSAFPKFVRSRDAVAHSGDKGRTQKVREQHSSRSPWKNEQISFEGALGSSSIELVDVLSQRQYSNTWQGEVISYEISLKSLETIATVRDEIYQAFQPMLSQESQHVPFPAEGNERPT